MLQALRKVYEFYLVPIRFADVLIGWLYGAPLCCLGMAWSSFTILMRASSCWRSLFRQRTLAKPFFNLSNNMFETFCITRIAFPYCLNPPAKRCEFGNVPRIARCVRLKLRAPIVAARLWAGGQRTDRDRRQQRRQRRPVCDFRATWVAG